MSGKYRAGKAAKAGIGYTVGNVLIKGINFMALPLFSRIMTTEEFGVYNVFVSYEAIMFVIVGMAIHSSVRSANIEYKGKINEYISSVSIIYLLNCMALIVLCVTFRKMLTGIMNFSLPVMCMMVLYSLSSALTLLYNNWISLDYSYRKYMAVALCSSVGNVGVSLLLIFTVFNSKKDVGRIVGVTTVGLLISAYILYIFYKNAKPRICKTYWKFALKYSLPIVPHGISQVLLGQFDRIMIRQLVSDSAAGIYSFAGNIKLILTIITDSVGTAWTTWFYEKMVNNQREEIQKRAVQLGALFSVFAIGLMALSPELIAVLGGVKYNAAKYVAVPMIMDAFVLFLYSTIIPSEYYAKKTNFIMLGTVLAAIINVITNYIFIKMLGYIAAAYTTLFSYLCYLILHTVISYKVIGFHVIPLKWLVIYIGLVAVAGAADLALSNWLILRWLLCASIVIPILLVLMKKSGIDLQDMCTKKEKK